MQKDCLKYCFSKLKFKVLKQNNKNLKTNIYKIIIMHKLIKINRIMSNNLNN